MILICAIATGGAHKRRGFSDLCNGELVHTPSGEVKP